MLSFPSFLSSLLPLHDHTSPSLPPFILYLLLSFLSLPDISIPSFPLYSFLSFPSHCLCLPHLHSFLSVPPPSLPLPFLPLSFFLIPYSSSLLLPPPLFPLSPFLPAHIPLFLYPFLHTVSKSRPFEYLRLTSLGVVGALVKVTGLHV